MISPLGETGYRCRQLAHRYQQSKAEVTVAAASDRATARPRQTTAMADSSDGGTRAARLTSHAAALRTLAHRTAYPVSRLGIPVDLETIVDHERSSPGQPLLDLSR